jgi:hypothetical protein
MGDGRERRKLPRTAAAERAEIARQISRRVEERRSSDAADGTARAAPFGMDEHEVKRRFDRIDARLAEIDARFDKVDERFAEMQRLLEEGERTRKHVDEVAEGLDRHIIGIELRAGGAEKVQKVVLTEIRGLGTKIDRLTRVRRGRPTP